MPKKTEASLLQDIVTRPYQYLKDVTGCPAILFSAGNNAYAIFLGAVAGVEVGVWGALAIQGGITAFTAINQIRATYQGMHFDAPYKIQACANAATAAILLTSGIAEGPEKLALTLLPVCTFSLWGAGLWNIARCKERQTPLQQAGKAAEEITRDPLLHKFSNLQMVQAGIADVLAPFKNKPIDQIGAMIGTLVTHPALLTAGQFAALAPLPFFLAGLGKSFIKRTPFVRNPNNAYAMGYAVGAAIVAIASHEPFFAGAQALWAIAYRRLAAQGRHAQPVSANEYARRRKITQQKPATLTP